MLHVNHHREGHKMARGRGKQAPKRFRVLRVLPNDRIAVVGYLVAIDYGEARRIAREKYHGFIRIELA